MEIRLPPVVPSYFSRGNDSPPNGDSKSKEQACRQRDSLYLARAVHDDGHHRLLCLAHHPGRPWHGCDNGVVGQQRPIPGDTQSTQDTGVYNFRFPFGGVGPVVVSLWKNVPD